MYNMNVSMQEALMQLILQAPHQHVLVLDTNVCMNDIDLFELECPATSLIVVPQVRYCNQVVYIYMYVLGN